MFVNKYEKDDLNWYYHTSHYQLVNECVRQYIGSDERKYNNGKIVHVHKRKIFINLGTREMIGGGGMIGLWPLEFNAF